ncbi:MAG: GTPase domain-containing protein [Tabrizicola sp.]
MADTDGELTVAQRLGRALDRGLLPAGGPAEAAERLIERLERPARVALLGLPGAGKSSILNLLVGSIVVPETLRLPTIVVQHGDVSRMICTLTDGTTKILPGHDLSEVLPLAPALVTLEMDLPALRVISLLEVSAGPMEAEQKRAATWASKRADIVIWCTTSYLPKEQAVWESLPDAVKDNSFMFLTKVDLLGSRDSAQAMHDRVELRAGEEFRQILSISAKQARAAMPPGGQVNRELFRDSGAGAVITAIKTRVQSGRRADTDTAELLLARHVEATELVARRFAESGEEVEAPRPWTPPPEPEPVAAAPTPVEPEPEPVAEVEEAPAFDELDQVDEPAAEAAEVEPEPEPIPEPEVVEEPVLAAPEPEPEPVAAAPMAQEPVPAPDPEPEPEPEPGGRRRFADRIKRVASAGDAATPLVPLRSTWKSKAEVDAPPPAEPEPPARPPEPARRPRAAQPSKEVIPVEPTPVEPEIVEPEPVDPETVEVEPVEAEAVEEPPIEVVPEPEVEEPAPVPVPRERTPRAVTPRPVPPPPTDEAARVARPNLFGARRTGDAAAASPLPDLSKLRATPEEMEAALQVESEEALAEQDEDLESAEPEIGAPEPEEEAVAEPEPQPDPAPVERPARTAERPRLFDRVRPAEPPPAPAPTARPDAGPRTTPLSRSPAPPRMPAPSAPAAPPPAPTASAADDDQFSPRAIMRREPRAAAEAPPPRRERPRIAARAVPVAAAPAAAAPMGEGEQELVDEAIRLIATRSAELASEVDPEAKVPVDLILEHTRETTDQVIGLVSRGKSDELRRINSDLGEVMDLILLMQLEKGHAPADDALTLLLQLKRELETLRAA